MTFWADRSPLPSETGAHLHSDINAAELAISHISYAASALTGLTLTPEAHARAEALVKRLAEALGR